MRAVAITSEGREFGMGLMGPGEVFLQASGEAVRGIAFYVEALEDSRFVSVTGDELATVARQDSGLAARLLQGLCLRACDLDEMAASLALEPVAERLQRVLRRVGTRHGELDGGGRRVRLRQQDVASMTGACREAVNAALRDLEAQGAVRRGRHMLWLDLEQ